MNVLVSACLMGENCKYNGGNNHCPELAAWFRTHEVCPIPFCPEQAGGLSTPRCPAERRGDRVVTREGDDVTAQFLAGAWLAVETALANGCRAAVLKRKSPSCGCGEIYDGSFSGTLTKGNGLAAQLLLEQGVAVYCEDDYGELFRD